MATEPVENLFTAVADTIVAPLEGRSREVFLGESLKEVGGIMEGFQEGLSKAMYILRTGNLLDDIGKIELRRPEAIRGPAGAFISIPTRFLQASDAFFKTIVSQMKMNGLAYREARKAGLSGVEFAAKMASLKGNPTDDMIEQVAKLADNRLFHDEVGKIGKLIGQMRTEAPALNFIIPFIQTPINVTKFGLERGALTGIPLGVYNTLRKEGVERSEALGRTLFAGTVGAGIAWQASKGNITADGPSNAKDRALLQLTGWQPYSIKIGDKWISYKYLEPIGQIFYQPAKLWQDFIENKNLSITEQIESIVGGIAKKALDQTFLTGLSDWLELVQDPSSITENRALTRWIGGFIPNVVATTAQAIDPVLRETRTVGQELTSRIPFLSQTLPAKESAQGLPIIFEGHPLFRAVSPGSISTIKFPQEQSLQDSFTKEMVRDIKRKLEDGQSISGYPGEVANVVAGEFYFSQIKKLKNAEDRKKYLSIVKIGGDVARQVVQIQRLDNAGVTREDREMLLYQSSLFKADVIETRLKQMSKPESKSNYLNLLRSVGILTQDVVDAFNFLRGYSNELQGRVKELSK